MKRFLVNRTHEDGFTMIELLVVVIIIAILAAVAVPVYIGIQNNAKKSAIAHDVDTTKLAVAAALAEDATVTSGTYTASGSAGDARVYNSGIGGDETIKVTLATDGKSYTVEGGSAKLKSYTLYNSTTGATTTSDTAAGSAAAAPAGTITYDMEDGTYFATNGYGSTTQLVASARTTTKPHAGSYSLQNTYDQYGGNGFSFTPNTLTVGKTYTVSAWIHIAPNSGAAGSLRYYVSNSFGFSGTTGSDYSNPVVVDSAHPANSWYQISFPLTATATRGRVSIFTLSPTNSSESGSMFVDDVAFTPTS